MKEDRKFIFSVIVPVYDRERYLRECVDSVIGQTVGFEENIQLILVNNASTDGSGDICREYAEQYPDNVVYVELTENVGPSGGRSAGIPYIQGELVNFLDSDDKWALDAFEKVWGFYDEHKGEIECVACRIKSYGDSSGWHATDYVFDADHIVNIYDQYSQVLTRIASAFITADAAREVPMDVHMVRYEDTLYVLQIILRKKKYGALRSAMYYYRKHHGSLMESVQKTSHNYFEVLSLFHDRVIEDAHKRYGRLLPYEQYELMYDIQWRVQGTLPASMSDEEISEYREHIRKLLLQIDDYIICEQRNIYKEYKIYCLRLKYGDDFYSKLKLIDGKILFDNLVLYAMDNRAILNYWWHEVDGTGMMRLTGEVNFPFPKTDYEVYVKDDQGRRYELDFDPAAEKPKYSLGEVSLVLRPFQLLVPAEDISSLCFYLRYQGAEFPLYINAGKFSRLSFDPKESYIALGGQIFSRTETEIVIEDQTSSAMRTHKKALWRGLVRRKDKRLIACRLLAAILRKVTGKQDVRISFGDYRVV